MPNGKAEYLNQVAVVVRPGSSPCPTILHSNSNNSTITYSTTVDMQQAKRIRSRKISHKKLN
jgi:hypothetical protein